MIGTFATDFMAVLALMLGLAGLSLGFGLAAPVVFAYLTMGCFAGFGVLLLVLMNGAR